MVIKKRQSEVKNHGHHKSATNRQGDRVGLSSYAKTYVKELRLPEFEKYAADRLAVLRCIHTEQGMGRDVVTRRFEQGQEFVEQNPTIARKLRDTKLDKDVQKDNISHFILRLGFCNTEENRKWFLKQEVELFKFRYELNQSAPERKAVFDELLGTQFETVDIKQLYEAGPTVNGRKPLPKVYSTGIGNYSAGTTSWGGNYNKNFPYYKVSILDTAVHWMVEKRMLFVKAGYAYVPAQKFKDIVFGRYRTRLSKELLDCRAKLHELRAEDRVYSIIANLHKAAVGDSYKPNSQTGSVKPKDVPMLVNRGSFPICMRGTYEHLKKDSHLKHAGRMHFGLFLKSIGMSMEDALKFWQKMFAKKTSHEKFAKNYAYNIRHNYGKEGNRKDDGKGYSAYSCAKIIGGDYAADDHAGCPFKLMDEENLDRRLRSIGLNPRQSEEIIAKKKDKHYNIACRLVFKHTHSMAIRKLKGREWEGDIDSETQWNHPNSYFDLSRKVHEGFDVPLPPTLGGGGGGGIQSFPSVAQMQGGMHPTQAAQNIIQPLRPTSAPMDVSS